MEETGTEQSGGQPHPANRATLRFHYSPPILTESPSAVKGFLPRAARVSCTRQSLILWQNRQL